MDLISVNPSKRHVPSTYLKNPRDLEFFMDPILNSLSARSALLEAADIMYLENEHKVINRIFGNGKICSASNTPALAKKKRKSVIRLSGLSQQEEQNLSVSLNHQIQNGGHSS